MTTTVVLSHWSFEKLSYAAIGNSCGRWHFIALNKTALLDFPDSTVDKSSPANVGGRGLIPGLGRFLRLRSKWAHAPQLLSLCSRALERSYWARKPQLRSPCVAAAETHEPGACAWQQEKPGHCKKSSPCPPQLERAHGQHPRPSVATNQQTQQCAQVRKPHYWQRGLLIEKMSITVISWHCLISAAAAKLLQSCPTLCDPIDGSPPGSTVPGILQARTLEWVAIPFSNARKWKVKSEIEVTQSCPTLSDPMDCSVPGSSVHGVFQARVLEWGAITFSSLISKMG